MKSYVLLILVSVLVCCVPTISPGQDSKAASKKFLKRTFDKRKNVTTVTMKTISLGGTMTSEVGNLTEVPQLDLEAYISHPGEQLTAQVEEATLRFKTLSRYPVFQRPQNLVGVLNDERALILGTTEYKAHSRTFGFEEVLTISIPYEAMQKIAEAKTLKFVLGQREIKLRENDFAALRELAKAMTPPS